MQQNDNPVESRLDNIEKNLSKTTPEKIECVYCHRLSDSDTGQTCHLGYNFNSIFFTIDLVKEFLDRKYGLIHCNHSIISNDSVKLVYFLSNSIDYNDVNIDKYNPHEFISLFSDFKQMQNVFTHYKNKRFNENLTEIQLFLKIPECGDMTKELQGILDRLLEIENDSFKELSWDGQKLLSCVLESLEFPKLVNLASECLETVGQDWILTQSPDKYDIGYVILVEKYGKNFESNKNWTEICYESDYPEIIKSKLSRLGYGYPFDNC